jgi:hypothetical protein
MAQGVGPEFKPQYCKTATTTTKTPVFLSYFVRSVFK